MATTEEGQGELREDVAPQGFRVARMTRESYEETAGKVLAALGEHEPSIMPHAMALVRLGLTTLACNGLDKRQMLDFIAHELKYAYVRAAEEGWV